MLRSVNPASDELIRQYEETTPVKVGEAIARADRAFSIWRATGFGVRAAAMLRTAELLDSRRERFAALMADEMGKLTGGLGLGGLGFKLPGMG